MVVEGQEDADSSNLPYYTTPTKEEDMKPLTEWTTPQHDNESISSTQTQTQAQGPDAMQVEPPAYMDYQQHSHHQPHQHPYQHQHHHPHQPPLPLAGPSSVHGLPGMGMILNATQDTTLPPPPLTPSFTGSLTQQLIRQALIDVARLTRRDRFLARIESAAEELALRVAEYNDYLRTPAGMAELAQHYRDVEAAAAAAAAGSSSSSSGMMPAAPPGPGGHAHAHDARMETGEDESAQHDRSMA